MNGMIACVGDLMVDVFSEPDGKQLVLPGGKAANYGGVVKVLGSDAAVVGAVGRDDWGRTCHDAMRELDLDVSGVAILPDATTGADFFEDDDWRIERGANWALSADHVTKALGRLDRGGRLRAVIVNQGVSAPASEAALRYASEHGIPVALNLAPEAVEQERQIDPALYAGAKLVVVNQIEAEVLHQDLGLSGSREPSPTLTRRLAQATNPEVAFVHTTGPDGAFVATPGHGGRWHVDYVPPHAAPVSDPRYFIGAGDATLAALLTKLLPAIEGEAPVSREEVLRSMDYAMEAAARTLDHVGTMTAMLEPGSRLHELSLADPGSSTADGGGSLDGWSLGGR